MEQLQKDYNRLGRRQEELPLDGPGAKEWVLEQFGQKQPDKSPRASSPAFEYMTFYAQNCWQIAKRKRNLKGKYESVQTKSLPNVRNAKYKIMTFGVRSFVWDENNHMAAPISVDAIFDPPVPAKPAGSEDDAQSGMYEGQEEGEEEEAKESDPCEDDDEEKQWV